MTRGRLTKLVLAAAFALTGCDEILRPEFPVQFIDVSTGGDHTCAVSTEGTIYCWGRGQDGELGFGYIERWGTPREVVSHQTYRTVVAGYSHSCALTVDDAMECWGWNPLGQLGVGSTIGLGSPGPVAGELKFQSVTAGQYHTCGLTTEGEAYCWGYNGYGQLGDGTRRDTVAPSPVAGELRFTELSAGAFHTCGIARDGATYCWGSNHSGQLGDGTLETRPVPAPVAGGYAFVTLSAGRAHTCAVTAAGDAYCWGSNDYGELGLAGAGRPDLPQFLRPGRVYGGYTFRTVSAGHHVTCGIDRHGEALCWGRGHYGQIGNGATTDQNTPKFVLSQGERFRTISAGGRTHVCGVTSRGTVLCWGWGESGQLGNPGTTHSATPVRIEG